MSIANTENLRERHQCSITRLIQWNGLVVSGSLLQVAAAYVHTLQLEDTESSTSISPDQITDEQFSVLRRIEVRAKECNVNLDAALLYLSNQTDHNVKPQDDRVQNGGHSALNSPSGDAVGTPDKRNVPTPAEGEATGEGSFALARPDKGHSTPAVGGSQESTPTPAEAKQPILTSDPAECSIVVMQGSQDLSIPKFGARMFCRELYPRGVSIVVISGGIGRGTPGLYEQVLRRYSQKSGSQMRVAFKDGFPHALVLPNLNKALGLPERSKKKLFAGTIDLKQRPWNVSKYVTEADIYAEVFLSKISRDLGISPEDVEVIPVWTKEENASHEQQIRSTPTRQMSPGEASVLFRNGGGFSEEKSTSGGRRKVTLILENGSTHTGNNISYVRLALERIGLINGEVSAKDVAERTILVQNPMLQIRSMGTFAKQFGTWPKGRTRSIRQALSSYLRKKRSSVAPNKVSEDDVHRLQLIALASGEYQRIPEYSDPSKFNFMEKPPSFPTKTADFFKKEVKDILSSFDEDD